MYQAKIYVTLKPTVNDPQGLTVKGGLHNLGFDGVHSVRVGKFIEIRLDETDNSRADEQIRQMCDKLLANPIIENFRFELAEEK